MCQPASFPFASKRKSSNCMLGHVSIERKTFIFLQQKSPLKNAN